MNRKIALITGASRGLGRSAALHLAAQGIDIIGTYNSRADEAQALVIEFCQRVDSGSTVSGSRRLAACFSDFVPDDSPLW